MFGILFCEGDEALKHVAQKNCGCPIPEIIQGQHEWGTEQCGLMEDLHVHGRELELK